MKIGIHKIGFETYNSLVLGRDTNGMAHEVTLLINLFRNNGYDVNYINSNEFDKYDTAFIFNGTEKGTSNITFLRGLTNELNYLLTDSRFYEASKSSACTKMIDNYFVQSDRKMYDTDNVYNSMLHILPLYEYYLQDRPEIVFKEKQYKDRLLFGGSVRDREDKVYEYLIRPRVDHFLKTSKGDNRLPIGEYRLQLMKYGFGIVLINPLDAMIGNITWRYYESIINNVITFIDINSDPRKVITNIDFLYVNSYREMEEKMDFLLNNEVAIRTMLKDQLRGLDKETVEKNIIDALVGGRSKNESR